MENKITLGRIGWFLLTWVLITPLLALFYRDGGGLTAGVWWQAIGVGAALALASTFPFAKNSKWRRRGRSIGEPGDPLGRPQL